MLTREEQEEINLQNQTNYLTNTRRRLDNRSYFSSVPTDLICELGFFLRQETDIDKALRHAAYARKEDVNALRKMLDVNPHLLLQTGYVKAPGGNQYENIGIYEFLLSDGDPELAEIVGQYFSKLQNITPEEGEEIRMKSIDRYQSHIEGILTQTPYRLEGLIDIIKRAPDQDVTALLNNDITHDSLLRDAMIEFRQHHAPRVITEPCMHYNYASLQHAFDIFDQECDNLYSARSSNGRLDKWHLVKRQLIGFELRRLPGVDRCAVAQILTNANHKRTYQCMYDRCEFPVTRDDNNLTRCDLDSLVDLLCGAALWHGVGPSTLWKSYVKQKYQTYGACAAEPSQATTPTAKP